MAGEIKEGTMAKIKIWMSSPSFPLYGTSLACCATIGNLIYSPVLSFRRAMKPGNKD